MYSNPVPFAPKAVEGISTVNDEYLIALSPDNEFAYYTRRSYKQKIGMLRPETLEEFTVSQMKDGKFDKGKKCHIPSICDQMKEDLVCQ